MNSTIAVETCFRDAPPTDFMFKIRSFSLLSETKLEKHESGAFQACGKQWKLCVYPEGNKEADGDGHISLYLQIVVGTNDKFPLEWEVHAKFKLYVFDHVRERYFTIQETGEKVRRFHNKKKEWGFGQLLPLSVFTRPSNGYLIDDTCAFGAEILVVSNSAKHECLSIVKDPVEKTYTWNICHFSIKRKDDDTIVIYSNQFTIEGSRWILVLYPRGYSYAKGQYLSLFLALADKSNLSQYGKLYAKYKLRICNQLNNEHFEKEMDCCFREGFPDWGIPEFMSFDQLKSDKKGFLVNDTLIVEVEFMLLSKFSDY